MKPRIVTYNIIGIALLSGIFVFTWMNMRVVAYYLMLVLAFMLIVRSAVLAFLKMIGVGR